MVNNGINLVNVVKERPRREREKKWTYPLRTPRTKLSIKNDPTTMSGMKKTQLNTLPRASLVWKLQIQLKHQAQSHSEPWLINPFGNCLFYHPTIRGDFGLKVLQIRHTIVFKDAKVAMSKFHWVKKAVYHILHIRWKTTFLPQRPGLFWKWHFRNQSTAMYSKVKVKKNIFCYFPVNTIFSQNQK